MNNISRFRNAKGWSQEVLADKLNVTSGAVAMWETGKRTPKITKANEMAKLFGVSIEDIFFSGCSQNDSKLIRC